MRASDNSPPARFVPFRVSVSVGASGTYTATPGAETVVIAVLHAALLHAASLSDLFSPGISVTVSHGGKPSRDTV